MHFTIQFPYAIEIYQLLGWVENWEIRTDGDNWQQTFKWARERRKFLQTLLSKIKYTIITNASIRFHSFTELLQNSFIDSLILKIITIIKSKDGGRYFNTVALLWFVTWLQLTAARLENHVFDIQHLRSFDNCKQNKCITIAKELKRLGALWWWKSCLWTIDILHSWCCTYEKNWYFVREIRQRNVSNNGFYDQCSSNKR